MDNHASALADARRRTLPNLSKSRAASRSPFPPFPSNTRVRRTRFDAKRACALPRARPLGEHRGLRHDLIPPLHTTPSECVTDCHTISYNVPDASISPPWRASSFAPRSPTRTEQQEVCSGVATIASRPAYTAPFAPDEEIGWNFVFVSPLRPRTSDPGSIASASHSICTSRWTRGSAAMGWRYRPRVRTPPGSRPMRAISSMRRSSGCCAERGKPFRDSFCGSTTTFRSSVASARRGPPTLAGVLAGSLAGARRGARPGAVLREAMRDRGAPRQCRTGALGRLRRQRRRQATRCTRCVSPFPADLVIAAGDPRSWRGDEAASRAHCRARFRFADAVFNLARLALLIGALAAAATELLRTAMQDRLHQPYRLDARARPRRCPRRRCAPSPPASAPRSRDRDRRCWRSCAGDDHARRGRGDALRCTRHRASPSIVPQRAAAV